MVVDGMKTAKRMTRRRKVLLWVLGGGVTVIGGLVVAFVLSSPRVADLPLDVEAKEIPSSWLEEETPVASDFPDVGPENAAPTEAAETQPLIASTVDVPAEPVVSTGRLAMIGDGKPFGEEAYELVISDDRAILRSSGRFWFKVVLATVQVTFEQTFEAGGDLRPVEYAAEFHAPLGFDRSIRATVDEDRVTVEESGGTEEIRIEPERTFALGTFSTYVLLPRLFALRQDERSASFEVLVFGGPPDRGSEDDSEEAGLPVMTIEHMGTASLLAGDLVLEADCYRVSSNLGESELYARGDEFLAFRSGDGDESLWVYRSDFFPDGVEVGGVTSLR